MKPWEETWALEDEPKWRAYNGTRVLTPDGGIQFGEELGSSGETWFEASEAQAARARLAAAAPDLVRVLLAVEWGAEDDGGNEVCPSCGHGLFKRPDLRQPKEPDGHAADCALDAALRKAGVR